MRLQDRGQVDVAVVGAGPAGALCAGRLSAKGYSVLLLDENPATRTRIICTGITGAEAFDKFRLPEDSILSSIRTARFISPGGRTIEYARKEPFAYVVNRQTFDGGLQREAQVHGAEIRFGQRVETVEQGSDGILLHCRQGERATTVSAKLAIFATGFNQRLSRQLNLGSPARIIQGIQSEMQVSGVTDTEVYFGNAITPGFFAWVVPISGEMARVGLLAPHSGQEYFERFLKTVLLGRVRDESPRISARPIVQGAVPHTVGDRFMVVGEAAGQIKTTTAGGIYYGLLCAELAASVADGAFQRGDLSRRFLARYQKEWKKLLGGELKVGFQLQQLGEMLSDQEIDRTFELIASNGLQSGILRRVNFDWHRLVVQYIMRSPRLIQLITQTSKSSLVSEVFATTSQ